VKLSWSKLQWRPFYRKSPIYGTDQTVLSYLGIKGSVDLFASVIFYFGFFLFIVLFFHVFNRRLQFSIPWWGACFSTAALTNASLRYANVCHDGVMKVLGGALLVLLIGLVVITLWHTLHRLVRGELLTPPSVR
jgi:tellurite resistance protein